MGRALPEDDAGARLRAGGLRATAQRRRVLEALGVLGHATPERIHAEVGSDVDLSTVYRALEVLAAGGLVQHTHLGHGSPTWSVRADTDAHVHLVCESCGGVLEAAASDILPLLQIIEADHGFLVDLGHLSLTGQCRECRTNGGLSPSPDRED